LLAVVIFGVSVFGGFVQDDRLVILSNPTMGKLGGLFGSLVSPYFYNRPELGNYRPLTSFSLIWDSLVFGNDAWGFRLINVLLYGFVCVGVYELAKRMQKKGDWAFWVAILFTVLPIHSEAVTSIVGRGEILNGGLVILMLILVKDGKWGWSILAYLLALLSKESAIVWVMPWGWMLLREKIKKDYKLGLLVSMMMLIVGYFVLRWGVLEEFIFSDRATVVQNPLKFISSGQRIMAGIGLVAFGVSKVLLPINLSYDYSFEQLKLSELTSWWFALGMGVILFSVWLARKKNESLKLAIAIFWLPLLVTGNILKPIGTIFGERLWFLPSLGVVMVVVMTISNFMNRRWLRLPRQLRFIAMTTVGVILLMFSVRTMMRNMDWLSEERLFVTDAQYVTGSVLAQSNAAAMYLKARDFDQAKIYLEKAEAIYPLYPELMNNWGIYYWWTGDLEEANRRFEKCLESHPEDGLCTENIEALKRNKKR